MSGAFHIKLGVVWYELHNTQKSTAQKRNLVNSVSLNFKMK
jgi:hypothetical protein